MNSNKVALITGANKGIGLEIARQIGAQGVTVLVGARDSQRAAEAVAELRDGGADAHPVTLDVTSADSIAAAASDVESRFGRLDILVNNAGIAIDDGPPSRVSPSPRRSCRCCTSPTRDGS
jgi:NAD(P)-dependent dehydrogenase (short-subunit alcohol dehydrogenase family)